MTDDLITRIDGLFLGKVEHRWEGRGPSAIGKTAVTGSHAIAQNGFVKDAQADLEHHGGRDKAIHHYATDHYADWIAEKAIPEGTRPAAFGENVTTRGMTEDTMCIGDILRLGSATIQISQGRQPCWKVAEHTSNPRMAALFTRSGRTGWYYRVLENGEAAVGDEIRLLERPQPDWSVKRVTLGRLTRQISARDAEVLAHMPELAEGWRGAFAKMAAGDRGEDTSRRLNG